MLFAILFSASLIAVGLGFLFHELMHRSVARKFGCFAEYRMWLWALALALILSFASRGEFVFAAPGAVYITPMTLSPYVSAKQMQKIYGLISLSGPIANMILAFVFYLMSNIQVNWFLTVVSKMGFTVNLWLAAFNLIPLPPFDGSKVIKWNPVIWSVIAIPTWVVLVLTRIM